MIAVTRRNANENDEVAWWTSSDHDEPLIGVPSVAVAPAPLPDDVGDEPEPGLEMEQEDAEEVTGFDAPQTY